MHRAPERSLPESAPDKIGALLRQQMIGQSNDGLFIVSMDHSPSEQLSGHDWHTTVLLLSAGMEHAQLADRVAQRLRPQTSTLMKWTRATKAYRRTFLKVFLEELRDFPTVYLFAVSAQEPTIRASVAHFIAELGLSRVYRPTASPPGKARVSLGPFVKTSTGKEITITLAENRATMCLFIGHFVLRMHRRMYEAVNAERSESPGHVNWNFYGDKFPGPPDSDMDLMFRVVASLDRDTGRIAWGYFIQGDSVETDLIVDNLAGALNEVAQRPQHPQFPRSEKAGTGFFYWERWS